MLSDLLSPQSIHGKHCEENETLRDPSMLKQQAKVF